MNDESKQLLEKYQPKEVRAIQSDRQVHAARFSHDGNLLAAGGCEGDVRRWDLSGEEPKELDRLNGHNGWVQGLVFHPDKSLLFTSDSWGQIRATDLSGDDPKALWTVANAHDGWIRELSIGPDGKLLSSCGTDGQVRLWSTASGERQRELAGYGQDIMCARFHPDGKFLATGDDRGVVKVWNASDGKLVRELDVSELYLLHRLQDVGGARVLAFDRAGKTLAVGGTRPKNGGSVQGIPLVLLFDFESGKLLHTLELGATKDCYVHDIRLHDDGFVMAVTSGTPGSGQVLFQRPGDEEPFFQYTKLANCHSLSMHPNGQLLAVTATNRGSNGNGRRLNKDGEYAGNTSPVHLFEFPAAGKETDADSA
jgi:WD40 repeat protein